MYLLVFISFQSAKTNEFIILSFIQIRLLYISLLFLKIINCHEWARPEPSNFFNSLKDCEDGDCLSKKLKQENYLIKKNEIEDEEDMASAAFSVSEEEG